MKFNWFGCILFYIASGIAGLFLIMAVSGFFLDSKDFKNQAKVHGEIKNGGKGNEDEDEK
jgi:hypothetical protein